MDKEKNRGIGVRIVIVELFFFSLMVILGANAVKIQIFDSDDLARRAEREYTGTLKIQGKRGEILDRNLKRLGTTIDALSLAVFPRHLENPAKDLWSVAAVLGVDPVKLEKKVPLDKNFVWIKRKISPSEADALKALKIRGLSFEKDVVRFYPNRTLAAQVIGFTGSDSKGLEGLEYEYDHVLKGKQGRFTITKDAAGRRLDGKNNVSETLSGGGLVLTIDRTIQYISEAAIKDAVVKFKAKSAMAVVMRPGTGEILSMALYPEFNPNAFSAFPRELWRNRTVTDPFEPGSVMKVFLAAVAMEKGYCTPTSIFFCENGKYKVGSYTVHDTHDYGWLTLGEIIKYSSNIGAVKISQTTGQQGLYEALTGFGFGSRTEICSPGETAGTLSPFRRWKAIDTAAISFGQGMSVSAVQLAAAFSAIANDGVLMRPFLVKKTLFNTGETDQTFEPQRVRQVISPSTAKKVREMMRSVVTREGTGFNAAIPGYSVCGKTGTAQKVAEDGKGYSKNKFTAVFAGFAPKNKPELAVVVVVDEPRGNHYGGVVAAPAFKNIVAESFHYLNIPPDVGPDPVTDQVLAGVTDGV